MNLSRLTLRSTRLLGLFAGASMAIWGLWLLLPHHVFTLFGGVYSLLGLIAPEQVWGAAFMLLGGSLFLGELTGRRWLVGFGGVGVLMGRLFVASLTGIFSHWQAPGVPDQVMWALIALIAVMGAMRREP